MARSLAIVCAGLGACLVAPSHALGQRIQFPSRVESGDSFSAPAAAPRSAYAAPPTYGGGPTLNYAPPTYDYGTGQPRVSLGDTIEPTPFDPYSYPGEHAPALPNPYGRSPGEPWQQTNRFLQKLHIENTWLARFGDRGFGVNDTDLNGTFAVPFAFNPTPFMITPGFTYHAWDGIATGSFDGAPDLPPRAYDAYLDTSWRPQVTDWLTADLGLRIGVYSDFNKVNADSVRFIGRGLGIVTLSPQWQVAAGVVYLDRLDVKILPAGGLIWTPNEDRRFEILFPNPKLAFRWTTIGNTDVWWYVSGEYGGGSWTIERPGGAGDRIDYNDLRAMAGIEGFGLSGWHAYFEVGYVFNREILYFGPTPDIFPTDTVMLRAGIAF